MRVIDAIITIIILAVTILVVVMLLSVLTGMFTTTKYTNPIGFDEETSLSYLVNIRDEPNAKLSIGFEKYRYVNNGIVNMVFPTQVSVSNSYLVISPPQEYYNLMSLFYPYTKVLPHYIASELGLLSTYDLMNMTQFEDKKKDMTKEVAESVIFNKYGELYFNDSFITKKSMFALLTGFLISEHTSKIMYISDGGGVVPTTPILKDTRIPKEISELGYSMKESTDDSKLRSIDFSLLKRREMPFQMAILTATSDNKSGVEYFGIEYNVYGVDIANSRYIPSLSALSEILSGEVYYETNSYLITPNTINFSVNSGISKIDNDPSILINRSTYVGITNEKEGKIDSELFALPFSGPDIIDLNEVKKTNNFVVKCDCKDKNPFYNYFDIIQLLGLNPIPLPYKKDSKNQNSISTIVLSKPFWRNIAFTSPLDLMIITFTDYQNGYRVTTDKSFYFVYTNDLNSLMTLKETEEHEKYAFTVMNLVPKDGVSIKDLVSTSWVQRIMYDSVFPSSFNMESPFIIKNPLPRLKIQVIHQIYTNKNIYNISTLRFVTDVTFGHSLFVNRFINNYNEINSQVPYFIYVSSDTKGRMIFEKVYKMGSNEKYIEISNSSKYYQLVLMTPNIIMTPRVSSLKLSKVWDSDTGSYNIISPETYQYTFEYPFNEKSEVKDINDVMFTTDTGIEIKGSDILSKLKPKHPEIDGLITLPSMGSLPFSRLHTLFTAVSLTDMGNSNYKQVTFTILPGSPISYVQKSSIFWTDKIPEVGVFSSDGLGEELYYISKTIYTFYESPTILINGTKIKTTVTG